MSIERVCEAVVQLGITGPLPTVVCGAPVPRDVCPFAERVVSGSCAARAESALPQEPEAGK
jgi:hypothetical protein